MARPKVSRNVIHLKWHHGENRVLVEPEDEDRFLTTVQDIITACGVSREMLVFKKQFDALLRRLAEWVEEHQERIRDAYITVRDAGLMFLVVQTGREYDRAFEDALTDLDLEVAQDDSMGLVEMSVLALPNCAPEAVEGFLSSEVTLAYAHAE